jgi:ATP-dependent helicase HrpA
VVNKDQPSPTQLTQWSFGELKTTQEYQQAGLTITLYPALIDEGKSVTLKLLDNAVAADTATRLGVARLVYLALLTQIKDNQRFILKLKETQLLYSKLLNAASFYDEVVFAAILKLIDEQPSLPRQENTFIALCNVIKSRWVDEANKITDVLFIALSDYQKISKTLNGSINPAWMFAFADIKEQIQHLFDKHFLINTSFEWLCHYPRYLRAIVVRLDKLSGQLVKDRQLMLEVNECWKEYLKRASSPNPALLLYRWMIEEYRVSVFAQTLGTQVSVSPKKLKEQLSKV